MPWMHMCIYGKVEGINQGNVFNEKTCVCFF